MEFQRLSKDIPLSPRAQEKINILAKNKTHSWVCFKKTELKLFFCAKWTFA